MNAEHAALVALLQTRPRNLTWRKLTEQVRQAESARDVWTHFNPDQLIPTTDAEAALTAAQTNLRDWHSAGLTFVTMLDSEFPQRLLGPKIKEPPPFLFSRGHLRQDDEGVAVVGSRQASPRGIDIATKISAMLVDEGISVISGLAEGIDAAAHSSALDQHGRTVAFIATGINQSYPASNRPLQASVADRGLLLSQFWPDAPPQKPNFLKRNALISAYSMAAIVVEAGENSGARNLAGHAVEQARPLILTDLVAEANEWAKALVDRPDVYVASSLAEIRSILDTIRSKKAFNGSAGDSGVV